jgi:hypothetical protein
MQELPGLEAKGFSVRLEKYGDRLFSVFMWGESCSIHSKDLKIWKR